MAVIDGIKAKLIVGGSGRGRLLLCPLGRNPNRHDAAPKRDQISASIRLYEKQLSQAWNDRTHSVKAVRLRSFSGDVLQACAHRVIATSCYD